MHWVHAPAGIPRGVAPVKRQWWLDFEEPIGLHDSGDTGVALLSRLPLSDVTRIDLPWQECPWRPRLAMAATIALVQHQIRLFNAHVDPHAASRWTTGPTRSDRRAKPKQRLFRRSFSATSIRYRNRSVIDTREFLEARGYTTPFPTGTATWRGGGLRCTPIGSLRAELRLSDGVWRGL